MEKNNIHVAGEFASDYIDKFITETLYNIKNPSAEQIKEKMERLEGIESGELKDNLSDDEVRIDTTNLFSKDKETGKVFFSCPIGELSQIEDFGKFGMFSFASNTCMSNQAFSGKSYVHKCPNVSATLQLAIQYHFLAKNFKPENKSDKEKFLLIKKTFEDIVKVTQDSRWTNNVDAADPSFNFLDQVSKADNGRNKKLALNFVGYKDFDENGIDTNPENNPIVTFTEGTRIKVKGRNEAGLISWIGDSEKQELFDGMLKIYDTNGINLVNKTLDEEDSNTWKPIYIIQAVMHAIAISFENKPYFEREGMLNRFNDLKESIKGGSLSIDFEVNSKMDVKDFDNLLIEQMIRTILGENEFSKLGNAKQGLIDFVNSAIDLLLSADHANQILKQIINYQDRINKDGFVGPKEYFYMSLSAILEQFILFLKAKYKNDPALDDYIKELNSIIDNLSKIEGNFWNLPREKTNISEMSELPKANDPKPKLGYFKLFREIENVNIITGYKESKIFTSQVAGEDIIKNMTEYEKRNSLFDKGVDSVSNEEIADYLRNNFSIKNDLIDKISNDRLKKIKEKYPDAYELLYSRDYFKYKNDQFRNNIIGNLPSDSAEYKNAVERLTLAPSSSFTRDFFEHTFDSIIDDDIQAPFLEGREAAFIAQCLKGIYRGALIEFQESYYKNKNDNENNIFDELIKSHINDFREDHLSLGIDLKKLSPRSVTLIIERFIATDWLKMDMFNERFPFSKDKCIEILNKIDSESTLANFVSIVLECVEKKITKDIDINIINEFKPELFEKLPCDTKFAMLEILKAHNRKNAPVEFIFDEDTGEIETKDGNKKTIKLKDELVGKIDFYNDAKFDKRKEVYAWFLKNHYDKLTKEQCSVINLNLIDKSNVDHIKLKIKEYGVNEEIIQFNEIDTGIRGADVILKKYFKAENIDLIKHVFKYPAIYKDHISRLLVLINDGHIKDLSNTLKKSDFVGSLPLKKIKFDEQSVNLLVKLFAKDLTKEQVRDIDLSLLKPDNLKIIFENHYQNLTSDQFESLFRNMQDIKTFGKVASVFYNFSESLKKKYEEMKKRDKEKYDYLERAGELVDKLGVYWGVFFKSKNTGFESMFDFGDVDKNENVALLYTNGLRHVYDEVHDKSRIKARLEQISELEKEIENYQIENYQIEKHQTDKPEEYEKYKKKLDQLKSKLDQLKSIEKFSKTEKAEEFKKDYEEFIDILGQDLAEKFGAGKTVMFDMIGLLKESIESFKFQKNIRAYNNCWMRALKSLDLSFFNPEYKLTEEEIGFFDLLSDNRKLSYEKLKKLSSIKDKDGYSYDFVLKNLGILFGNLDNGVDNSKRINDVNKELKLKDNTDIKNLINIEKDIENMDSKERSDMLSEILKCLNVMEFDNLVKVDVSSLIDSGLEYGILDFASHLFLIQSLKNELVRIFNNFISENKNVDVAKLEEILLDDKAKEATSEKLERILNKIRSSVEKCKNKKYDGKKKRLEFLCLSYLYRNFKLNSKSNIEHQFDELADKLILNRLKSVAKDAILELKGNNDKIKSLLKFADVVVKIKKQFVPLVIDKEILDAILESSDNKASLSDKDFDNLISCIDTCLKDIDEACMTKILAKTKDKFKISDVTAKKLFAGLKDLDSLSLVIKKLGTIRSVDLVDTFLKEVGSREKFRDDNNKANEIIIQFLNKIDDKIDENINDDVMSNTNITGRLWSLVSDFGMKPSDELIKLMIKKLGKTFKQNHDYKQYFFEAVKEMCGTRGLDFDMYKSLLDIGIVDWPLKFSHARDNDTYIKIIDYYLKNTNELAEEIILIEKDNQSNEPYKDAFCELVKKLEDLSVKKGSKNGNSNYNYEHVIKENLISLQTFYLFFKYVAKVGKEKYSRENGDKNLVFKMFSNFIKVASLGANANSKEEKYMAISRFQILLDSAIDNKIPIEKEYLKTAIKNVYSAVMSNCKEEEEKNSCFSMILTSTRKLYNNDEAFKSDFDYLKNMNLETDGQVLFGDVTKGGLNSFEQTMNNCYVEVVEDKIITKNDKIKAEEVEEDKKDKKVNLSKLKRLKGPDQKKEEKDNNNRDNSNK